MKRKSSQNKNTITGIACITVSLFVCLSIIFHNATDYDHFWKFEKTVVDNLMGRGGAFISYYLINWTFGVAALIPGILLFLFGWQMIQPKSVLKLHRISIYSMLTMLLISYGFAIVGEFSVGGSTAGYTLSGIIGGFFASYSSMYLGKAGTYIIYVALSLTLVVLWSNFQVFGLFEYADKLLKEVWKIRRKPLKWFGKTIHELKRSIMLAKSIRKENAKKRITSKLQPMPESVEPPPKPKEEAPFIPIRDRLQAQKEAIKVNPVTETEVSTEIESEKIEQGEYNIPPLDLLDDPPAYSQSDTKDDFLRQAEVLETTLLDFGVRAKVTEVHPGPVLTLYEVRPETGVKINKILSLQDDLARTMQAKGIRIMAPIPGKDTVGIEIPNHKPATVYLKELLADPEFQKAESRLTIALGKTISGKTRLVDLTKMPHVLIAGSTGSGKSIGIATLITSILYKSTPQEVQFVMIDPKMLELSIFKKLKSHHLLTADFLNEEVITKPQNAVQVLRSCVQEMERRYEMLAKLGVRNIEDFNAKEDKNDNPETNEYYPELLPYIVVIIDELADLMLVASKDVEEPIARLAQMARAVGIHLVLATQRPSVDVLTGVIKANFPARIAYQVTQKVDSRTILDMNGAEQLLGKGDMLYLPPGMPKPERLQNPLITTNELDRIIKEIAGQPKFKKVTKLTMVTSGSSGSSGSVKMDNGIQTDGGRDPLFNDAARLIVIHQQGSISLIQRRLKVGYSRAARLVDELEDAGIVGPYDGSKARQVLIEDEEDLKDILE